MDGGLLVGEEAVAPGLQELVVEVASWGGWGFGGWRLLAPRAVAPVADSWSIWRRVRPWVKVCLLVCLVSCLLIEGILEQFVQSPKLVSLLCE